MPYRARPRLVGNYLTTSVATNAGHLAQAMGNVPRCGTLRVADDFALTVRAVAPMVITYGLRSVLRMVSTPLRAITIRCLSKAVEEMLSVAREATKNMATDYLSSLFNPRRAKVRVTAAMMTIAMSPPQVFDHAMWSGDVVDTNP